MSKIALQRKESDKAASTPAVAGPSAQAGVTSESGAAAGVPLFLVAGKRSAMVVGEPSPECAPRGPCAEPAEEEGFARVPAEAEEKAGRPSPPEPAEQRREAAGGLAAPGAVAAKLQAAAGPAGKPGAVVKEVGVPPAEGQTGGTGRPMERGGEAAAVAGQPVALAALAPFPLPLPPSPADRAPLLPPEILSPETAGVIERESEASPYDARASRRAVQGLVGNLRSRARGCQRDIGQCVRTASESISLWSVEQQMAIHAASLASIAEINGKIAETRAAIAVAAGVRKAEVTGSLVFGFVAAMANAAVNSLEIEELAEASKKQAADKAKAKQEAARKLGADEGSRGRALMQGQAAKAMERGNAKAAGYEDSRRGRVQMKSVLKVARETAAKLLEPAPELERKTIEAGEEIAKGFEGAENNVVAAIDKATPDLTATLLTQGSLLGAQFLAMQADIHKRIDDFVAGINARLDAIQATVPGRLAAAEVRIGGQIGSTAANIQGMIGGEAAAVNVAIDSYANATAGALGAIDTPHVPGVQAAVDSVELTLDDLTGRFREGLSDVELATRDNFAAGGGVVVNAFQGVADAIGESLSGVLKSATQGLALFVGKTQEASDEAIEEWRSTLADTKKAAESKYGELLSSMEESLNKTLQEGSPKLKAEVDKTVAKNEEVLDKLDGKMEEAARKAREEFDAPWYKNLGWRFLKGLWGLFKNILLFIGVLVLAVFLAIVAIVALIKGAIVLAVLAIAALAVLFGYVIYELVAGVVRRIASAKTWWQYITGTLVGVLDIVGIPSFFEGIFKIDLVNFERLGEEEATDRLGSGMFGILALLLPLKLKPKAPKPGAKVPLIERLSGKGEGKPVEAPKVEVAPEVPKVEKPAEAPKAEIPAEAPKVEKPAEVPKVEELPPEVAVEAPKHGSAEALTTDPSPATVAGGDLVPGSPAHKAARWAEYLERRGTDAWHYERWSKVYDQNMVRARLANEAANAYQKQLGWGKREVTVDVEGVPRRLDVADPATRRAVEVKTGDQYLTQDNSWEIMRDRVLVEQGWEISWHFDGYASRPLLRALHDAGITVTGI